ncbi:hypothetical protein [Hymenobacter convexus]|uniref:hypothetical protein n=1 Tax=Hymenobacter sp. CA1UV-4 TaxID=3063782 RepID=UPI00271316B6|nr:hypothetical protein [Hymenobacter sp. CA1UV-4]MDO7851290.1 hypothetical protein [Hymenobacter sp. CA1UV-4]
MTPSSWLPERSFTLPSIVNYCLLAMLVLVLGTRLSFLGAGALTFPDEYRYYESIKAIECHGSLTNFSASISQVQGRPGDAFWRLVPAGMQVLLAKATGLDPHEPASLLIPVGFNYLILLGSLLLFYRIALLLLRHPTAALLSTVVYACLVNTNIYLRHVLPYDAALFTFLANIYWVLRLKQRPERRTNRTFFLVGALAGFTFAIYPGYNPAVVVMGLLLLEKRALLALDWKQLFRTGALYSAGVAAVFGFFQLLSVIGDKSYLDDCLLLSRSITQGDFEEGFIFLFKYLFTAEQTLGYLLTGLGIVALPVALYRLLRGRLNAARLTALLSDNLLLITMVLAFLHYAVMVYYQERMVFYGRILHLYLPFFVLLIFKVLYPAATRKSWQFVPVVLVAAVAAYSFAVFTLQYHRIVYPLTFLNQHAHDYPTAKVTMKEQTATANTGDYYRVLDGLMAQPGGAGQPQVMLVNMGFLYPIRDEGWCNEVKIPPAYKLISTGPHFITLPAYYFEGWRITERDIITRCQYQVQVYEAR